MTRLELLRENMLAEDLDAIILFGEHNARYITDLAFSDGFVFVTGNTAHIFTDFRYFEVAERTVSRDFTVIADRARTDTVRSIIKEQGISSVGVEIDTIAYSAYLKLKEDYPTVALRSCDDILLKMRRIKSSSEIELIKTAQSITDRAFSAVLKRIKPDMSEIELAAEIEYNMRLLGADGPAFDTIAVSGASSALPHGVPENKRLERGFLTMDFGAKYKGYCSDMTRTVVIGKADDEMKKLYNTVLAAQIAALDKIKAGADLAAADAYARDVIDSFAEYKGSFGHSLGHGVGLEVHEAPSLSPRMSGRCLLEGEVVTVEPGIYLYGKYGCRIEDMVQIRRDGVYNFTSSTKDLIEIL